MNLRQKGEYKSKIAMSLYGNLDLKKVLLDDYTINDKTNCAKDFKNYVKSHLFVDGTVYEPKSYIFYDVIIPDFRAQTKTINIIFYVVCHRDILDNSPQIEGVSGNRADVLAMLVDDALAKNGKDFGIGLLNLEEALIYNGKDYYGTQLTYTAVDFR